MTWELVDLDKMFPEEKPAPIRKTQPQCYCGRFAKFIKIDKHYNGWWMLETMYLNCSRCGEVTVELV